MNDKAKKAYKILGEDNSYKIRIQNLVKTEEFGFAILILWNRIEITLKILKYYDLEPIFPDKLDFIHGNWKILRNVKLFNIDCYNKIINRNDSKSLWKLRDRIAHASYNIDKNSFEEYKTLANQFLTIISQNLLPVGEKSKKKAKKAK
jgi:hypothetical protein